MKESKERRESSWLEILIDKLPSLLKKKVVEKEKQKIEDKNFQEFWKKKCAELEKTRQ